MPDQRFVAPGGWKVEVLLGRGGMGEVYRVRHSKTKARAALKVLLGDYSKRSDVVARFRQEAIAVNIINSPGIVRVFDSGELADGRPYILMEYLDGKVLRKWIETIHSSDRIREVVRIGYQVASVMAEAHERKVVHRDLKPENIMVVSDDLAPGGSRAKILDFGIAKVTWPDVPDVDASDELQMPPGDDQPTAEVGSTGLSLLVAASTLISRAEGVGETLRDLPLVSDGPPSASEYQIEPTLARTDVSPPKLPDSYASSNSTQTEASLVVTAVSVGADASTENPRRIAMPPIVPTMPYTSDGARGMGTPTYMAPEQEEHSASVDDRADVYSLGIMFFELLEGKKPDRSKLPWPPTVRAGVSLELSQLLSKMLASSAEERPAMALVAATLRRISRAKPEFEAALDQWIRGNKNSKFLPRGKTLHELVAWAKDIDDLEPVERSFLEDAARSEAARERMIKMSLIAGVAALASLFVATTYFWIAADRARAEAQTARESEHRHALEEEAAKREANEHAAIEERLRKETQDALERMRMAQRESEAAFYLAEQANTGAGTALAARNAMAKAKRLAEQAAGQAQDAAAAAREEKEKVDQEYRNIREELDRSNDLGKGLRQQLDAMVEELRRAKAEIEQLKIHIVAKDKELGYLNERMVIGESDLNAERRRSGDFERRLQDELERVRDLRSQNEEQRQIISRIAPPPDAGGD
ncbi:MAG TPA: protein kinase [Sorangium sp.]|nr:protein kinase [Sorangium sp.]